MSISVCQLMNRKEDAIIVDHKQEWNSITCDMDGIGTYYVKWDKPGIGGHILPYVTHMWILKRLISKKSVIVVIKTGTVGERQRWDDDGPRIVSYS